MAVPSWRAREATRQAHRRDKNELIEHACDGIHPTKRVDNFVCECGDPACARMLALTLSEYETVRAHPKHFVIAANHENPDAESLVTENIRFSVVETLVGEASKVALRTDPRALYSGGTRT